MRGTTANGEIIRAERLARGLTQERFAALAGLDVKTVRKAERGKRLDIPALTRIAAALRLDLSRLIVTAQPQTDLPTRRKQHIVRWHQAWDDRDPEAIVQLYHDDAVMHLPGAPEIPFGGSYQGRDKIGQGFAACWAACRTAPGRAKDSSLLAVEGTVVVQGLKGFYLPTGELAQQYCLQLFAFHNDLIADHRIEFDTLKFARLMRFLTS